MQRTIAERKNFYNRHQRSVLSRKSETGMYENEIDECVELPTKDDTCVFLAGYTHSDSKSSWAWWRWGSKEILSTWRRNICVFLLKAKECFNLWQWFPMATIGLMTLFISKMLWRKTTHVLKRSISYKRIRLINYCQNSTYQIKDPYRLWTDFSSYQPYTRLSQRKVLMFFCKH